MSIAKGPFAALIALSALAGALFLRPAPTRAAAPASAADLVGTVPTRHVLTVSVGGSEAVMEIYGFSHEVVAPRDAASGLPTGKRQHKPFTVIKPADAYSSLLLSQLLQGGTVDWVRIESFRQAQRGAPMEKYETIEMANTLVSSYQTSPDDKPSRRNMAHEVREHVSFTYQKITWTWADGSTLSDTWDLDP